jgi:cell wall-associated NlpC family hydrolase
MAQVGAPYRYGGSSPAGFDCSGLVIYSYRKAGLAGLPHSAAALEAMSEKIPLQQLEPGDLLFFRLGGAKANHVAIYVGGREFVHAPSGGKRVEKLSFDHVYWGPKIKYAGRLLR